ncbi:MAG TPA: PPC domain-containing protein [Gemmataceae bacterium]|nr:PPC domain-containing protein [Gemmataceae bacterium]
MVVLPLGAAPGKATKLTVRGHKLDAATAVRFPDSKATGKVLSKGKAPVPNMQDAKQVGDTQVEIEVTLPADGLGETVSFVVLTPAGETPPHRLLVDGQPPVVAEKEPNNGFRQAQPVALPQVVQGGIAQPQDVDVYRFEGKAGQRVRLEVLAARHGSALDSILSLHDADGRLLARNDDADGSPDSRLEVTLPRDGAYFVSIQDAHDQGGPVHVYRLVLRPAP